MNDKFRTASNSGFVYLTNMCSAIQPSSRAITLAILRAKHFLPSSEFPPYPLPNDFTLRSSGRWAMSTLSGLHGQWLITLPVSKNSQLPVFTCWLTCIYLLNRPTALSSGINRHAISSKINSGQGVWTLSTFKPKKPTKMMLYFARQSLIFFFKL